MNKKISLVLYLTLAVISALLLFMTVFASSGMTNIWKSPVLVWTLVILGIAVSVSVIAFNPRKNVYSIGFYVLHIGIVLFLIGSLVYYISGYSVQVSLPVVTSIDAKAENEMIQNGIAVPDGYYNQVRDNDGKAEDLGFNFRAHSFVKEFYDEEKTQPKHYEATISFFDGKTETKKILTVNHPIYEGDWKIYLMGETTDSQYGYQRVQLLLKKDPTEFISTSGIVLTIIGTFMMCFIRPKDKSSKGGAEA